MPVKVKNITTNNNGRDGTHVSGIADAEIGDVQASGNRRDGVRINGSIEGQRKGFWIKTVIATVVAGLILFYLQGFLSGEQPSSSTATTELPQGTN